jgi:hypothetical protein
MLLSAQFYLSVRTLFDVKISSETFGVSPIRTDGIKIAFGNERGFVSIMWHKGRGRVCAVGPLAEIVFLKLNALFLIKFIFPRKIALNFN